MLLIGDVVVCSQHCGGSLRASAAPIGG
jgi:hypothetical protein